MFTKSMCTWHTQQEGAVLVQHLYQRWWHGNNSPSIATLIMETVHLLSAASIIQEADLAEWENEHSLA